MPRQSDSGALSRRGFLALATASTAFGAARIAAEPGPGWIAAVTRIHGLPGHADDLKLHLLSLAAPTRAEPGCVTYDLYQGPDAPHEFLRFEIWTSRDALEAHKQTPHLRASFEKRQREGWSTEIAVWERVPG